MELIASGRDCDIFDAGPGRVLRRAKDGRSLEGEAKIMRHVHEEGYPVPAVLEVRGNDLVLERVDGPTMADWLLRGPWRFRRSARLLGELHDRLHRLPAPDWLPAFDDADGPMRVLHFDLHPLNVIMSASGPVVIDWPNARRGSAAADVAQTWVIMATSEIDDRPAAVRKVVGLLQQRYTTLFLRTQDLDAARRHLPAVAEHRKRDRNVRPVEMAKIDRLVASESSKR